MIFCQKIVGSNYLNNTFFDKDRKIPIMSQCDKMFLEIKIHLISNTLIELSFKTDIN